MRLIISPWHSPSRNRALEEYLLTERLDDVLLLYRNEPCVIVGRNQTIEAEVDLAFCRAQGITVLKRLSGGGTVYHDLGNINYAFVCNKLIDKGKLSGPNTRTEAEAETGVLDRDFTGPIVVALRSLGVEATVGPRKELLVAGYKISGTASHITRGRQLFHGTLLHRSNLKLLTQTLQGNASLRGKGVASVPSPVGNIAELRDNEEETEHFLERLARALLATYPLTACDTLTEAEQQRILGIEGATHHI